MTTALVQSAFESLPGSAITAPSQPASALGRLNAPLDACMPYDDLPHVACCVCVVAC